MYSMTAKSLIKLIDKKICKNFFSRLRANIDFYNLVVKQRRYFDGTLMVGYKVSDSLHLRQYCEKYGTDKVGVNYRAQSWPQHNYADIYSLLFGSRRKEILKVFEVGIGTKNLSLASNMGIMDQAEPVCRYGETTFRTP